MLPVLKTRGPALVATRQWETAVLEAWLVCPINLSLELTSRGEWIDEHVDNEYLFACV